MWLVSLLISIFGCSSILTSSFDLGGVISGNRMAGAPLGRSLGDGEVDVEGVCTESGMACNSCSLAVTCVLLPVGWLKVPLKECSETETCNAHVGGCSGQPVPECDVVTQKYRHTCEQVGIFPDPFDCRKFHLCSPPAGSPSGSPADHRMGLCPRNYGYDPSTAQCSVKLTKGQCTEKVVPDCNRVGEFGVLASSPNHYYVCLSKQGAIYPQIFICPHGWYFWEGFCRPEPPEMESTTKPSAETTSIPTTTENLTTEKQTATWLHNLFATEKPTTSKPDSFLADRFDMSNYASYDTLNETPTIDDGIVNSWEGFD